MNNTSGNSDFYKLGDMILDENEIRNAIMQEETLKDQEEEDEDIEREAKAISEQKRVVRYLEQVSGINDSEDEEDEEKEEHF